MLERVIMTISERIKELADKQGKSLQKVSEDLGFGVNYLYRLKNQQPTAEKLTLIADYVSVDYLLGRAESKPVNEPIDLAEVANSDDDAIFDSILSAGGRPLTEKDKAMIKLVFADRWEELQQKAKGLKDSEK